MTKYFISTTILFLTLTVSFGQTQNDMNQNEYNFYKKAEKEINSVYQKILKEYSSDPEFIKNLKAAQRLWIQFRDADVKAKYPNKPQGYYGSVYPMCVSSYMTQLTNDRIKTLRVWLTGIEEGDVCSGSVKTQ